MLDPVRRSFNLETAVGRPLGCVPRGVWQGTTRRNSYSIPTSCNAARRRAGRAPGVVAPFTLRESACMRQILSESSRLRLRQSGQLPFLGSITGQGQPFRFVKRMIDRRRLDTDWTYGRAKFPLGRPPARASAIFASASQGSPVDWPLIWRSTRAHPPSMSCRRCVGSRFSAASTLA